MRGRGLGRAHAGAAVVLGAGAALDALVAAAGVATGDRPAEPIPFTGYLLLSVLAVPVGWRYARSGSRGWDAATFALGDGRPVRHLRAARPDVGLSHGPPRLLGGAYVLFAIAAGARSGYQLATRFGDAPLAYHAERAGRRGVRARRDRAADDRRALLAGAASVELAGVLGVGALTLADPSAFPDETVWSRFGQGYGYLPLVLPIAALAWLRVSR